MPARKGEYLSVNYLEDINTSKYLFIYSQSSTSVSHLICTDNDKDI